MCYNAKNCKLNMDGSDMEYIRFGTGERIFVMLPGLGDGLRTVKGTALPMALMYRMFAKEYTQFDFRGFGHSNTEKEVMDTMKTDGSSKQNAVRVNTRVSLLSGQKRLS